MHFARIHFHGVSSRCWQRRFSLLLLAVGLVLSAQATHNRAGEITYTHVDGLTYEILITTYTKTDAIADRPWLYLFWGDENDAPVDSLERESTQNLTNDVQVNLYRGEHTYGGPGFYEILVEDPNRNDGVLNIPGSVDVPFSIRTLLVIDPQAGHNNSVQLLNPAQQNACLLQPWIHNPGAHDPDGDMLTYDLIDCRGFDSEPIPDYISPDAVSGADDVFSIDPVYGDVTWETPQVAGEYNVAIRIREWREVSGALVMVGEVVRDMQISVQVCQNQPPVLEQVADTCIVAGSFLTMLFSANDADGDLLDLDAIGAPLTEVVNPAIFSDLGAGIGQLVWLPECLEVREEPYQILVRAEDNNNQVPLMDIETVRIRVIAPAVDIEDATPVGNSVILDWNPHNCLAELPNWKAEQGEYHIYRRIDSLEWIPGVCETGIAEELGFELIANVTGLGNTVWVDTSTLSYGATYCYRIVTEWPGSGESIASDVVCATIAKDVPVMTKVSVVSTDAQDGVIDLGWSPPTDADTLLFPGPYFYEILGSRNDGNLTGELVLHETTPGPYLASDTVWTHIGLDSETSSWTYRVRSISAAGEIGVSSPASSPWLSLESNDNQLTLQIEADVPWMNHTYRIYREDNEGVFQYIGESNNETYVDSGLVNNVYQCYRVETLGNYEGSGIPQTLVNWSQEACGRPFDFTPPCPPVLSIEPDCSEETNAMMWADEPGCADDISGYVLYWAPTLSDSLEPFQNWDDPEIKDFLWNEEGQLGTIAGCFALSALDSLLPGPDGSLRRNESELSEVVCVDNCPFYFLPNVFSPNGDGINDEFEAFPWKFIDHVDFRIYNRLGEEVFQTDDPAVNWTGEHKAGGTPASELVADGVYYYTARVFTIRLTGLVEERFSGELQLMNGVSPVIK
jgi:gliding motility-associated-like protein